jgi:hypothetical protein
VSEKTALAAWSQSALRPVELPSGMKALVVIPDVNLLVRKGKLPDALTGVAMQFATTGVDVSKLNAEETLTFIRLTYELIGDSLRYIATSESDAWEAFRKTGGSPVEEGWEPIKVTGAELAEMGVDQPDLEALGQIVGRVNTPNEVTIRSRSDRALMASVEGAPALTPDAGQRVGDFAGFRGEPASADDRPDGGDVRATPVGAARSAGSGRRAGTRRSRSG